MSSPVVSRCASIAAAISLSMVVASGPVMAQSQAQQPAPPRATAPAPGSATESTRPAPADKAVEGAVKAVEGSVKKVDPAGQTVQISAGFLGLMGKTLQVDDRTQIQVEGRQGTLADIREGTKVKASYEPRDGRNIATRIEVAPMAELGASTPAPNPTPRDMGTKPGAPKY